MRTLAKEAATALEQQRQVRSKLNESANSQQNALRAAGVQPDWIAAVREQVNADAQAQLVKAAKKLAGQER